MFASITAEELHGCIKKFKRDRSPSSDGVSADMDSDSADLMHECLQLLHLFNCMLASHFPECLPAGMITAIFKWEEGL